MDPITPDQLRELVATHTFTQLENTSTIVCLMVLKSGAKVIGYSFGPLDPARFDFEKGCNIAYDKALAQLWDFEGYHRLAMAALPDEQKPMTPVAVITDDMKLPDGSAVFQIINQPVNGEPNLDMRGVLIGTNQYDPANPAHRVLACISNNIDSLMTQATGGNAVRHADSDAIEQRLLAGQGKVDRLAYQYGKNGNPAEDPFDDPDHRGKHDLSNPAERHPADGPSMQFAAGIPGPDED